MEEAPEGAYEVLWDDMKGGDKMAFEYLASVQSAVRRFNYRMQTIADKLGKDTQLLDDYKAKLDVMFPNNYRLKDGVPQLLKPREIFRSEDMSEELQKLDSSVPTWPKIRDEYTPYFKTWRDERPEEEKVHEEYLIKVKEEGVASEEELAEYEAMKKKEEEEFSEFISYINQLPDALVWMYAHEDSFSKGALEIMKEKGHRRTYEEIKEAIDKTNFSAEVEKMVSVGNDKTQPSNLFDGLF